VREMKNGHEAYVDLKKTRRKKNNGVKIIAIIFFEPKLKIKISYSDKNKN
jgi:hypothetical protein